MIHPPPEPQPDQAPIVPGLPRDPRRWLLEVLQIVLIATLLYLVMSSFVAQPYRVELTSMRPTLEPADHVLIDKLSPRWDAFGRGEIVVFDPPSPHDADGIPYVKRVIGLPGDTVTLENGRVAIAPRGGVARIVDEPYRSTGPTLPQGLPGASSWTVPDGAVFLLGDNRAGSIDSRTFGPIAVDRIIGRAWLRYLPLTRIEILGSGD